MGIEPTLAAWKAEVLPLNYTCISSTFIILLKHEILVKYFCIIASTLYYMLVFVLLLLEDKYKLKILFLYARIILEGDKMSKPRNIPTKNYILVAIIGIITVVLTLYINAWAKAYKENKISVSPFSGVIEEVNIKEINVTFSEMNEVVLYVGYTNNRKIYDMEERLLKYIKNHDLVEKFIYVDATEYLEKDEYLKILKNTFEEVKDEIKGAPALIYVKNGKAEKVINSTNGIINTYDVSSLNETYQLEN